IDLDWSIPCPGYLEFGIRTFKCWLEGGHGKMKLLSGIQRSCDVFFYKLMLEVELETWNDYMKRFGFGSRTGIDLPGEVAGLVPDKEYFDKRDGINGWTKGNLLNLAIGQGETLVTPFQMAMFALKIGNNGRYHEPHLLEYYENSTTGERRYENYDQFSVPGISDDTFEILKRGMNMVVDTQNGTAKSARVPGIKVAGKTGTAQNSQGEDHAMFISFAPLEDPEIAISVIVENAGMGSAVAAPIAGRIMRYYFSSKNKFAQN
ncbi:penicillin-binding transpeptidase domain-containing protein, partial [candidate division KSB1 bacterium]